MKTYSFRLKKSLNFLLEEHLRVEISVYLLLCALFAMFFTLKICPNFICPTLKNPMMIQTLHKSFQVSLLGSLLFFFFFFNVFSKQPHEPLPKFIQFVLYLCIEDIFPLFYTCSLYPNILDASFCYCNLLRT